MKLLVFVVVTFISAGAFAQDTLRHPTPYAEEKDITDYFKKKHRDDSLKEAKKVQLTLLPAAGYTLQTGFALALSANVAFYTNHAANQKISSIFASYSYSQYNQTILPLWANIWSRNGKFNYVTDWRFMQYPSKTWGLGGRRDPVDGFTINFSYVKLHQMVLFALTKNLFIGTGYFYDNLWNIREVDAPANNTSFQRYGLNKNEVASGVPFRLLYDSRLNQINPKNGLYASITYRVNSRELKSNQNWQSLVIDVRKYIRFPRNSDNILALWSYSWLTHASGRDRVPYLCCRARVGTISLIRGGVIFRDGTGART